MLKSSIWVAAHIRHCFLQGLTAVVANKGAPEAGAIYLLITINRDEIIVLAPPPGPSLDERGERTWIWPLGRDPVSSLKAEQYIARQRSYDPDIWVVDIDDKTGRGGLDTEKIKQV